MELFDIPETPPSELQSARLRFDAAKAVYDASSEAEDEHGDPIPRGVSWEYKDALACLRSAEANELRRLRS